MAYRTYICDDCGFSSEEEAGVYLCPKCNNKMRIAKANGTFGGGDSTCSDGKYLMYILFFIFVGSILIGFLNIIGVILFIILFLLFRKVLNDSMRDKAIKIDSNSVDIENTSQITNNAPNTSLCCTNCGQKLQNDAKFCPNCGKAVEK